MIIYIHLCHHKYNLVNYNKNMNIVLYKQYLILKILVILKNLKILNKAD